MITLTLRIATYLISLPPESKLVFFKFQISERNLNYRLSLMCHLEDTVITDLSFSQFKNLRGILEHPAF